MESNQTSQRKRQMTEQESMFQQLQSEVLVLQSELEKKEKEISNLKVIIELLQREKYYDV
jgi:predicted RNase H-like nuclease (RuvC/YqgF family)